MIFTVASQLDDSNIERAFTLQQTIKTEINPDEHFLSLLRDTPKLITPETDALRLMPEILSENSKIYRSGTSLFQIFYNQVVQKTLEELIRIRKKQAKYRSCHAGKKFMTLYENGNMFACENRPVLMMGNIRENNYNLTTVLKNEKAQSAYKKQMSQKCQCDWGCAISQNLMSSPIFIFESLSLSFKTYLKSLL